MESDRATDALPVDRAAGTQTRRRGPRTLKLTFFREFLRHPAQIGSIVPSSGFLERRLIETARIAQAKTVIELGPGTGGTTRAILAALDPGARLLAIEINPVFAALLQAIDDRRLIVHTGTANDIGRVLTLHRLPRPQAVLSGIPFSTLPAVDGRRILEHAWTMLAPGGRLVAYQFRDRVAMLGRALLGPPDVGFELRNVPPMRVYTWTKPAQRSAGRAAATSAGRRRR